jgi:pimeloyl-ACP methyl ester carboxylesterase
MDRYRSKDGTVIACEATGWGPPVVLVHGTAADHTRWAPIVASLAQGCTVHAMDRRGRGGSGDAPGYAIEREFEDVAAVVEALGVPVDLIGHSLGALCSVEAARLVSNIRRLVLYEPPLPLGGTVYPAGIAERLQGLLDAGDRESVVLTFMREVPRVPEDDVILMRSLPAWPARVAAAHTIVREIREHEKYAFQAERFRDVRVPTLLLVGGESAPPVRQAVEAIHVALASSRIVELPGQKHIAMDTSPDVFIREVLGFLSERVRMG